MRKGVILVVVMGVMMVLLIWAFAAMYFMTTESRLAGHKMKRAQAVLAAQSGIIQTMEQLRKGADPTTLNGQQITITNLRHRSDGTSYNAPIGVDITIQDPPITGTGTILDGTREITASVNY